MGTGVVTRIAFTSAGARPKPPALPEAAPNGNAAVQHRTPRGRGGGGARGAFGGGAAPPTRAMRRILEPPSEGARGEWSGKPVAAN